MNLDVRSLLIDNQLRFVESNISKDQSKEFWHSSLEDASGFPVSGGYGSNRNLARVIAISEWLERDFVMGLRRAPISEKEKWDLDRYNSACGFAAGFIEPNVRLRSIQEAAERWVMSLWIDDGYSIPELSQETIEHELSAESKYFISLFDEVRFFKKVVLVDCNGTLLEVEVAQTMGYKGCGIYPGSSGSDRGNGIWEHALLESARHLLAVKNNPDRGDVFPDNRMHYFSKNRDVADEQIGKANKEKWPIAKVRLHRLEKLETYNAFIARTILAGWQPWNEGPIDRFVY